MIFNKLTVCSDPGNLLLPTLLIMLQWEHSFFLFFLVSFQAGAAAQFLNVSNAEALYFKNKLYASKIVQGSIHFCLIQHFKLLKFILSLFFLIVALLVTLNNWKMLIAVKMLHCMATCMHGI